MFLCNNKNNQNTEYLLLGTQVQTAKYIKKQQTDHLKIKLWKKEQLLLSNPKNQNYNRFCYLQILIQNKQPQLVTNLKENLLNSILLCF